MRLNKASTSYSNFDTLKLFHDPIALGEFNTASSIYLIAVISMGVI